MLEAAGVEVTVGVLAEEARRLNEAYLKWVTEKLPFVTLKTAMTLDGKIATAAGKSQWITGEAARRRVHEMRDASDAILVGIGTVLADDPSLTTRLPHRAGKNPLRVVLDSAARTPHDARLVTDGAAPTVIAVSERADQRRVDRLRACGAEVVTLGAERVELPRVLDWLGAHDCTSLLVEGGAAVNWSFLSGGYVDRICAFIAPMLMGGGEALTPVGGVGFDAPQEALHLHDMHVEQVGADLLVTGSLHTPAE